MRRSLLAALGLLALAVTTAGVKSGPGARVVDGGSSPPAGAVQGQVWVRDSDNQVFTYDSTNTEWLGELIVVEANSGAANAINRLKYGSADTDTTTASPGGWYSQVRVRIVDVRATTPDAAVDATIELFAVAPAVAPVALSTFTWNGPWEATDFTAAAGDTLTAAQALVVNIDATSSNPANDPIVYVYIRERVVAS